MPRWARWLLGGLGALAVVVVIAVVGFATWFSIGLGPMPEALAALQSSEQVEVGTMRWYTFTPKGTQPTTGFVIYPGGRVDPRSYAPAAHELARRGHQVVIVPVPINFALLAVSRAADVKAAYPGVQTWAVGGHSLGGVAASMFAASNPTDGLVLWASFPDTGSNLSGAAFPVTSIFASNDLLATPQDIRDNAFLLPAATRFAEIVGGNHAYFGWYGPQDGDGAATITREQQLAQQVDATDALLRSMTRR